MGQVFSAVQGYIQVMWVTFTGPPRPALSGVVSPKIQALMEGYKGGKSATSFQFGVQMLIYNKLPEVLYDMQPPAKSPTQPISSSFKRSKTCEIWQRFAQALHQVHMGANQAGLLLLHAIRHETKYMLTFTLLLVQRCDSITGQPLTVC